MNSFENEVMNSFGVKLRSRPRRRETNPSHPSSMKMARPQSMAAYPSPIRLSRFVYLPSNKGEDRRHLKGMENFRPQIVGSENWDMGYRQCQFMPGNSQWNRGKGKNSKDRNFFTRKTTSNPMRRSQSFNQVSFPHPSSLPIPGQDHHSVNPLLASRARSLSASQTSLSSNISKLSFKLSNIFGSRSKHKESNAFLSEQNKRQLPNPEHCSQELPYIAFHRPHKAHHSEQHFSDLCRMQQHSESQPMFGKWQNQESDLPDLVPYQRLDPYQSLPPPTRINKIPKHCIIKDNPDVWFSKERLFKDHIDEVVGKWENIDDEIWAKVIIFERNRRVAKAYARSPVLTINGSDAGFNGLNIGVNGFENPKRDREVRDCKAAIGEGCKLKMTENGDILIKRIGNGKVFIENILEEAAVSNDILKLKSGLLEPDSAMKLFDMKKFKQNMNRELKRLSPDRIKLEKQCILCYSLIRSHPDLLQTPIWMMLINIVALEMLYAKIPSNSDSNLDSTGFSSESSSAVMNTEDCYKTKSGKYSDSDYYSGYSAWTRRGRREEVKGEVRCGRRRLPVPKTEDPTWLHDLGNATRRNQYSDS